MTAFLCFLVALQAPAATTNVEAFRKATLGRDFAWFERTFAPDYVQILGASKIDRRTALATMKKGLAKSPVATLEAKVAKTKPLSGGFVATVLFEGTMKGLGNGRPVTVVARWRDDQTWTKAKGKWLLRSTRTSGFERSIRTP